MELFTEAGIFAWVGLVVFVGGIGAILAAPRRALARGAGAATLVLAVGLLGAGLGQRLVDRAVTAEPDLDKKVAMLSLGTREAAANELLGGAFAVFLLGIGAGVGFVRRDEER